MTAADSANPADLVRAHLDRRGWIKGEFHTEHGSCLDGATSTALCGDPVQRVNFRYTLRGVVREQFPDRLEPYTGNDVAAFNDHPDTVRYEVDGVLDKAGARYDEQVL